MNELERALREAEVPDAVAARERARQTVLAAHRPVRRRPRLALVWVAVALRTGGGRVLRARHRARAGDRAARAQRVHGAGARPDPGAHHARRGGCSSSTGDALFVVSAAASAPGSAPWRDATWSPRGLFVGVAAGNTLAAIEPDDGTVRWRLRRPAPVQFPRWAPGGLHIAYRSGGNLRIVYGNGQHDVLAGRDMAAVAPAWRPNEPRTVAWAAKDGHGHGRGRGHREGAVDRHRDGPVRHLAWSADGRRLLVAGVRNGTIHDFSRRRARATRRAGRGSSPWRSRARLALAAYDRGRTTVTIDGRTVLTAPGRLRDLEWSPDGRRLLAGWPGADHWLVVRGRRASRPSGTASPRTPARAGWVATP